MPSDKIANETPHKPDASGNRSGSPPPSPGSPASTPTPPVNPDLGVDRIVQDIREGLAHISARELELRHREQEFERRYRDLKQAAERAAEEEHEQTHEQMSRDVAELNTQAVEIAARQTRLNDFAQELRAQQIELERQRHELALQKEHARQEAEALHARAHGIGTNAAGA